MLPALHALCSELTAVLGRTIAYAAALAGIAVAAVAFLGPLALLAEAPATARSAWSPIDRLAPAFQLPLDEAGQTTTYAVLRHATGGGRKDTFTAESPAGNLLRLEIYRPGSEIAHFGDPESEIAAGTTDLYRTGKLRPAPSLETKFGSFHLVSFQGRRAGITGNCVAFSRHFDDPRLRISGVACNPGDVLIDRATIACALDRLTLLTSGGDAKTAALFAQAEINRNFCGQQAHVLAKAQRRNAKEGPLKLRGRLAAR